ncbi:hypothetical protein HAX54_036129 [Datura stramonium]|uniref:Uncharacterized protein n=1 Tax=Datura stramonium TaxID=4076 RepID=A0ABS8VJE1_DATST|nr:hypothetical protein [Datura stramonium]
MTQGGGDEGGDSGDDRGREGGSNTEEEGAFFYFIFLLCSSKKCAKWETHLSTSQRTQFHILEKIEREYSLQPVAVSARAAKRKPKRPTTFIDEFLDESSQLRHVFFPDQRTAVDPRKDYGNDTYYYHL